MFVYNKKNDNFPWNILAEFWLMVQPINYNFLTWVYSIMKGLRKKGQFVWIIENLVLLQLFSNVLRQS